MTEFDAVAAEASTLRKRKRGPRDKRLPSQPRRQSLGIRVAPEIKRAIATAGRAAGRSSSQEAELRLVRSFRDDEVMGELRELRAAVANLNTKGA